MIVVGLVAAVVMWTVGGTRQTDAVEGFARAPVGCDTTLDFVETGEYFVFIESAGQLDEIRGDCDIEGRYDVGSGTPDVEITIVDPDGAPVDLDRAVTTLDYDEGGFVGSAAFTIDIAQTDDHVVRVESADDEVFVVAIGRDPADGVAALRLGAVALGLARAARRRGPDRARRPRRSGEGPGSAVGPRTRRSAGAVRTGAGAAGAARVRPAGRATAVRPVARAVRPAAPAAPAGPVRSGASVRGAAVRTGPATAAAIRSAAAAAPRRKPPARSTEYSPANRVRGSRGADTRSAGGATAPCGRCAADRTGRPSDAAERSSPARRRSPIRTRHGPRSVHRHHRRAEGGDAPTRLRRAGQ